MAHTTDPVYTIEARQWEGGETYWVRHVANDEVVEMLDSMADAVECVAILTDSPASTADQWGAICPDCGACYWASDRACSLCNQQDEADPFEVRETIRSGRTYWSIWNRQTNHWAETAEGSRYYFDDEDYARRQCAYWLSLAA